MPTEVPPAQSGVQSFPSAGQAGCAAASQAAAGDARLRSRPAALVNGQPRSSCSATSRFSRAFPVECVQIGQGGRQHARSMATIWRQLMPTPHREVCNTYLALHHGLRFQAALGMVSVDASSSIGSCARLARPCPSSPAATLIVRAPAAWQTGSTSLGETTTV